MLSLTIGCSTTDEFHSRISDNIIYDIKLNHAMRFPVEVQVSGGHHTSRSLLDKVHVSGGHKTFTSLPVEVHVSGGHHTAVKLSVVRTGLQKTTKSSTLMEMFPENIR